MEKKIGIVAVLLLLGAIVMVSGCISSSDIGTGPGNCPLCGEAGIMPITMESGVTHYTCADCGVIWGEYPEEESKLWSYISDVEDGDELTEDEVNVAPL